VADEMFIDAVDAPRSPNRPTAGAPKHLNMKALERIRETGRHAVGNGLYLQVATGGARSWLYRYQQHGRRHDMGLGPFPAVTLAMAREAITKVRQQLHRNEDPLAIKQAERAAAKVEIVRLVETFDMAAESYIAAHSAGWKNTKSADQWRASLATYAGPRIGHEERRRCRCRRPAGHPEAHMDGQERHGDPSARPHREHLGCGQGARPA
jgi:hypothetical protein